MEIVGTLNGIDRPSAPDGREMSVVYLKESVELGDENALIITGKDVVLTLGEKQIGTRIDIYIEEGASIIIDGGIHPVVGGYIQSRGAYRSDSTILEVSKAGRLGIFFDGSSWRYYGMIYGG